MRWIAWRRINGQETTDRSLERLESCKLHLVADVVGGYGSQMAGKAACGIKVSDDDPDVIAWWVDEKTKPWGVRCLRCQRIAQPKGGKTTCQ